MCGVPVPKVKEPTAVSRDFVKGTLKCPICEHKSTEVSQLRTHFSKCVAKHGNQGTASHNQGVLLVLAEMVPGGLQRQNTPGCGSGGFQRPNTSACHHPTGAISFKLGASRFLYNDEFKTHESGKAVHRSSWYMLSGQSKPSWKLKTNQPSR